MNHQVGKWTLYDFRDYAMLFKDGDAPIRMSMADAQILIEFSQFEHHYIDKMNPEPAPDPDKIRVLAKWLKDNTRESLD